jgi:hypothetical protein
MKHPTAPLSLGIKLITGGVLALGAVFFVLSYFTPTLFYVGVLLLVVSFGCYLRAPIAYDVSQGDLTVLFRYGSKVFSPIVNCSPVPEKIPFTIRVWGNGGLFAGTGFFWNKPWGIFRAYVTTSDKSNLVLVETPTQKVIVSPSDATKFISDLTHNK